MNMSHSRLKQLLQKDTVFDRILELFFQGQLRSLQVTPGALLLSCIDPMEETCFALFFVTMQAQKTAPPDMQIKDKFLVQTTAVPSGITDEGILPAFFSKESSRYVEESKLRVVLVSATRPEAEQLISRIPSAKTTIEVPVGKETLSIVNGVPNVANQIPSFPSLRESPAVLSEIPFPVKDTPTHLRDFSVPSKEAPVTSSESAIHLKGTTSSLETLFSSKEMSTTLKGTHTVLRDFPVLLKEAPATPAESVIHLKETPTDSVETQFSSTEMNMTFKKTPAVLRDFPVPLKESPATSAESAIHLKITPTVSVETQFSSTEVNTTLTDIRAPKEVSVLSDILINMENLHPYHVEDVQNIKSELSCLEDKLKEAEKLIIKLREDARTTIQERDKLRHEMMFFKRKGGPWTQAGFPPLFVAYIAVLGVSLGYLLHL